MEENRSSFKILTGTPTGKRRLGRPRRRCEDNISMYLKETDINTRFQIDNRVSQWEMTIAGGVIK